MGKLKWPHMSTDTPSVIEVKRVAELISNTQPHWSGHLLSVLAELETLRKRHNNLIAWMEKHS